MHCPYVPDDKLLLEHYAKLYGGEIESDDEGNITYKLGQTFETKKASEAAKFFLKRDHQDLAEFKGGIGARQVPDTYIPVHPEYVDPKHNLDDKTLKVLRRKDLEDMMAPGDPKQDSNHYKKAFRESKGEFSEREAYEALRKVCKTDKDDILILHGCHAGTV